MADAMMMFLGEAHGVNWYWAQPGEFENPGVYYWDGAKNVLCVPHLAAAPEAPAQASAVDERAAITEEDAYEMGAKGAEPTEHERKLFEAWMRGHCWALSAHWDGRQYVSDAEQDGDVDPRSVATRRIFAAWRDRAALAQKGGAA